MNNFRRIGSEDGRSVIDGYEVVDLGLPSGTLWATYNVGATSETEYGDLYAYGGGTDKMGPPNASSYYSGTENPLNPSKDTVRLIMGSNWRLPTKTQVQELFDNTTHQFVKNFKITEPTPSFNGWVFASKIYPNRYVFLPAAGDYVYGNHNEISNRGNICGILTCTPGNHSQQSWVMHGLMSGLEIEPYSRTYAFSARGVHI